MMAMSRDMIDTDRITSLLLADAVPSLGERARAEVRQLVANYEQHAQQWMEAGASVVDAQHSFNQYVVDGLQQKAHDLFWDTRWPACPRHPQHPLWYDEDRQAWCCQRDRVALAPLGGLTDLRSPAV
jgi:hypothetical protein